MCVLKSTFSWLLISWLFLLTFAGCKKSSTPSSGNPANDVKVEPKIGLELPPPVLFDLKVLADPKPSTATLILDCVY